MIEIWKDVVGYEGLYMISNMGRLISFHQNPKGKLRKFNQKDGGYLNVDLYNKTGDHIMTTIHQLVAEHFVLGKTNDRNVVNHKNGNKHDCVYTNLEWVTSKENTHHAMDTGLRNTRGEHNPQAKLTEQDVINIRTAKSKGVRWQDLYLEYKDKVTKGTFKVTYYGGNWKHIKI